MKKVNKYILLILLCLFQFGFSQRENENWTFGHNKWSFNYSTGNLSTSTLSSPPYIRAEYQGSATYSNPLTGALMFYTDGIDVYNKNSQLMDNGSSILNESPSYIISSSLVSGKGLTSLQPVVIVPHPGNSNQYYIFLNGNYDSKYWYTTIGSGQNNTNNNVGSVSLGLQYAIVDMSYNSGLGRVISKGNVLLSDVSEGLTTTYHADGESYWVIAKKGDKFYSYKISVSGIQLTPVISNGSVEESIIKVSPNARYVFSANVLYDFNNNSGVISNPLNITSSAPSGHYLTPRTSYAEFSPDSNILYFVLGDASLGLYNSPRYLHPGLAMYNISTGSLIGSTGGASRLFPLDNVASLQLAPNGKIYLTFSRPFSQNNWSNMITQVTKQWAVITNPNNWDPTTNPLPSSNYFSYPDSRFMSFSFPQLIQSHPTCLANLNITNPIISNQDYQVSNLITASSTINPNLNVNFKANEILLQPGFQVSGFSSGNFSAIIEPCQLSYPNPILGKTEFTLYEKEENSLSPVLYPNPSNGIITIEHADDIIEWKVVDINGVVIISGENHSESEIKINIRNVVSGLYYFNAFFKSGELFQKTIIKK